MLPSSSLHYWFLTAVSRVLAPAPRTHRHTHTARTTVHGQSLFHCTSLYRPSRMLHCLQMEGKAFHQRKDHHSLNHDSHFITAVWNRTPSSSEVCLQGLYRVCALHRSPWQ